MLVGRSSELEVLAGVIERVRSGGSASLVIRGEPGVGKTVLLNELQTLAHDFRVLRSDGIESEHQLDYAALHRILLPFLHGIPELPGPQREAIEAAFGISATGRPDRFLVGLASLTLLGDPERRTPLLVVVDDAQWLDQDSMAALAIVGRRLLADALALVFSVRDSSDLALTKGLAELSVPGLAEAPARELLTSLTSTPIKDAVAAKVVGATGGNPLALIGLAEELTAAQFAGLAPLPDPLPTSGLIEARFARQVQVLPKETQDALLLVAAEPTRDLRVIERAAEELGTSLAALEPAEANGLLDTYDGITFRHPLIRSAVYSTAPTANRRNAHLALAKALNAATDPERAAMHRASAAVGPEEEVAAALEQSAVLARRRGGYTAEAALLSRSAELSPSVRDRSRRLLAAANAASLAGNAVHAQSLLEAARQGDLDPFDAARAQLLDGTISVPLGHGRRAPALLLDAAKSLAALNRELSHRALLSSFIALIAVYQCAEGTTGREIGEVALSSLEGGSTDSAVDSLLHGLASSFACDYAEAASALRRALDTFEKMSLEEITESYSVSSVMANTLWDLDAFRVTGELMETAARQRGSILGLQPALLATAAVAVREGRFPTARSRYDEVVDITEAVGGFTYIYARLDVELVAWQGTEDVARKKIHELIRIATRLDSGHGVLNGHYAMAILELGLGRYREALNAALALDEAGMPSWTPFSLPQIVEAAMRCADAKTAASALERVEEQAMVAQTPFALGLMWRCRALVQDDDQTESSFDNAFQWFEPSPWRTELARTHLLYGEWLRRKKRRTDARTELRKAHQMFETIGAMAFAKRARSELAATGERARARRVESASDLTVRELQIARLAVVGLTSREIASQLFISPYTVDYHLRKVFQKLGVKSRIHLAKALPLLAGLGE